MLICSSCFWFVLVIIVIVICYYCILYSLARSWCTIPSIWMCLSLLYSFGAWVDIHLQYAERFCLYVTKSALVFHNSVIFHYVFMLCFVSPTWSCIVCMKSSVSATIVLNVLAVQMMLPCLCVISSGYLP